DDPGAPEQRRSADPAVGDREPEGDSPHVRPVGQHDEAGHIAGMLPGSRRDGERARDGDGRGHADPPVPDLRGDRDRPVAGAAAPETAGAAMLVPLSVPKVPCSSDESTFTPGADTSGLNRSEIGVGPADEKSATVPAEFTAAALIAPAALAGDPMLP